MGRSAGVGEAVLQQGLGVDGAQGVGRGDTGACDAGAVYADVRDLIVLVGREGELPPLAPLLTVLVVGSTVPLP